MTAGQKDIDVRKQLREDEIVQIYLIILYSSHLYKVHLGQNCIDVVNGPTLGAYWASKGQSSLISYVKKVKLTDILLCIQKL